MEKFRSLEGLTTIHDQTGSWYLRIPPEYAKHLQLKKGQKYQARIRTEKNKRSQPYCSIWIDGQ